MTENDFEIVEWWLREAIEYGEERHNAPYEEAIKALEEIQQYRAIGTIEEFKALKEKNEPKKIVKCDTSYKCPICNSWVGFRYRYCDWCGQVLDWQ